MAPLVHTHHHAVTNTLPPHLDRFRGFLSGVVTVTLQACTPHLLIRPILPIAIKQLVDHLQELESLLPLELFHFQLNLLLKFFRWLNCLNEERVRKREVHLLKIWDGITQI